MSTEEHFHELTYYTLAHPDQVYFIHQHAVDADQAQNAAPSTKPIGLFFSLVGLYLFVNHGYSGRKVQQAHMALAQNKKQWPVIAIPVERGAITVEQVVAAEPGAPRDEMIRNWCASVWKAYEFNHEQVHDFVSRELRMI